MKALTIHNRARNGSALVITVWYLTVLTILAAAFLGYLHRSMSGVTRSANKHVCLNIAEGGLDKAITELHVRPAEYRGESNTPLGQGRFSVDVTPGDKAGVYTIVATAELTDGKTVISRARIAAEAAFSSSGKLHKMTWSEVKRW